MQNDYLITLSAVDLTNASKQLRFSLNGYKDNNGYYEQRILSPTVIDISPNDGGLFNIFNSPSNGSVILNNRDGGLSYLMDYAIDGRDVLIERVINDVKTTRFKGTASQWSEGDGQIIISLRAWHETLTDNYPMTLYAGTGVLEGGNDIKDKAKPIVLGDCRNITPELVDDVLLIYQVSDRADCVIRAVYDNGVLLRNWQTNGARSAGATSIAVDSGISDIPTGSKIVFSGKYQVYAVTTGLSGNTIIISPALASDIGDNTAIEIVNSYANTGELVAVDWSVTADHKIGDKVIAVSGGTASITTGTKIMFSSHLKLVLYEVASFTTNTITLTNGLQSAIYAGDLVNLSPPVWASYNGYFRLMSTAIGTVTCDAVSMINDASAHSTGDVFKILADELSLTTDAPSVTELNTAGVIGLFIDSVVPSVDLFNKVISSVAGFYHFIEKTLYANLLQKPLAIASFAIEDWEVNSAVRKATGLGSNGLPIYKVIINYDKIETVQTNVVGATLFWQNRIKSEYRKIEKINTTTQTRHKLSKPLTINSLLRFTGHTTSLINRLCGVTSTPEIIDTRRDIVDITVFVDLPAFKIGDTVSLTCVDLAYSNRKMVVTGYKLNDIDDSITLSLFG